MLSRHGIPGFTAMMSASRRASRHFWSSKTILPSVVTFAPRPEGGGVPAGVPGGTGGGGGALGRS